MTIPCPLKEAARDDPDLDAITSPGLRLTFRDVDMFADGAADRFREAGLRPGDRVALLLESDWRYVVLLLGAIRSGIVACPLSTRLPSLERHLDRVRPRMLVTTREEVRQPPLIHPPDAFIARSRAIAIRPDLPLDRPATVVFTSGSTGEPRAALHTFGNHYYSAAGSNANIPVRPGDRWLLSLPLYHVGGLAIVFRCLLGKGTIVLPDATTSIFEAVRRARVTHVSMVATQLRRYLKEAGESRPRRGAGLGAADDGRPHPGAGGAGQGRTKPPAADDAGGAGGERTKPPAADDAGGAGGERTKPPAADDAGRGTLKFVLLGGSAIPASLIEAAVAAQLPVHTSYGLTEMASQVATTPPGAPRDVLRTSGRVLPHREVRVAADGEILVRGRTRFAGYVDGDVLHEPFDADGWFSTGDLGALISRRGKVSDAGGSLLRVAGRKDNMFISGGENVTPEEIEAALTALAGVGRAVVVPVADAEFGWRPVAFVDGMQDEERLRSGLERVLPGFMIPVRFFAWPESARDRDSKVNRSFFARLARERMASGHLS